MMARLVESRRYPGFESCSKLPRSSQALVPEDPELGQDLDLELGPVVEVSLDRPHGVEESCLNFCLTNQHQQMHLFGVLEVVHDCAIVSPFTKLWITTRRLDVLLQVSVQKLIDLGIVVIIMSYTPQTLDIIPACPPEKAGVYGGMSSHRAIGEVVDCPELVVKELGDVVVKARDHTVALLVPVEVIDPKGRKLGLATPLGKVDILKVDILDKLADVRLNRRDCQGLWANATQLHGAKPDGELLLWWEGRLLSLQSLHSLQQLFHLIQLGGETTPTLRGAVIRWAR